MIIQHFTETIRYILWGIFLLLMTALFIWLVQSESNLIIRPLVSFFYMLFLSGHAWIRILRLPYRSMSVVYSVPLSLALCVLAAQIVLYTGMYTIENGVMIICTFACLGLLVEGLLIMLRLSQSRLRKA